MPEYRDYETDLKALWDELHLKAVTDSGDSGRFYTRLELDQEPGVRVSCTAPDGALELLIEVEEDDVGKVVFPSWRGMSFNFVEMEIPSPSSKHILIKLEDSTNQDVFVNVCSDLVRALTTEGEGENKLTKLILFVERWTRFFESHEGKHLSTKAQAGLFAELILLKHLMEAGIPSRDAVSGWLGCEGGCHDFEFGGIAIEVKSTMRKEPKKIYVNSELQLNDAGFSGLFLYVAFLRKHESTGCSLPDLVRSIMQDIDQSAAHLFKDRLVSAGYIDAHSDYYTNGFTLLEEESYHVMDNFPRLLSLPSGVGDVKYSLLLSSCEEFMVPLDNMLAQITRKD